MASLGRSHLPRLRLKFWRSSSLSTQSTWRQLHKACPRKSDAVSSSPAPSAPQITPEPGSQKHHDLASFLQYAEQAGLDPKTTTYVGTHYEYTVGASLAKYGFSLRRIGGQSDHGIDLLGTWSVPSASSPIKVILQCKALSQKIGPHLVRELEGAFVGAPIGWRGSGVLGLLVAERPATKGIRDSLGRSRWPMGFISCSRAGSVQQMLWNRRAEEEGLVNVGVGLRHATEPGQDAQLVLTYKGNHIPWVKSTGESQ